MNLKYIFIDPSRVDSYFNSQALIMVGSFALSVIVVRLVLILAEHRKNVARTLSYAFLLPEVPFLYWIFDVFRTSFQNADSSESGLELVIALPILAVFMGLGLAYYFIVRKKIVDILTNSQGI